MVPIRSSSSIYSPLLCTQWWMSNGATSLASSGWRQVPGSVSCSQRNTVSSLMILGGSCLLTSFARWTLHFVLPSLTVAHVPYVHVFKLLWIFRFRHYHRDNKSGCVRPNIKRRCVSHPVVFLAVRHVSSQK